jgi:hypothetical protein
MKSRRRALIALPAAGLLAVAGIATAASGPVTVSGPSPYAACTIGGSGTNFPNAEVEPYVAANPANPQNVIGMWQQDRWSNGGSHGLVAGYTFDGGKTWGETTLPYDRCAGGLPYERASDPWVSIGPDGTAYSNAIVFDNSGPNNGVAALTSTDGGKTWGNLSTIVSYSGTSQFFTDKNSITANPGRAGVAYSVWDTLASPNDNPDADLHTSAYTGPGMFSATTDRGRTWGTPTVMFPTGSRNQTIGNQIVVDPRNPDVLYDFANWIVQPNNGNFTHSQVAFVKSVDGGANWSAPRALFDMNAVGVSDPNTGARVRTGDIIPEPAIGPDGSLYVVWQDGDFSGGAFDQIAFSSSKDGGATWSAPTQVSTPTGRPAFTPTVKVSSAGVVGITYYDFRNLAAGNTTSLPTDYWFTSSTDGGATFSASRHLAGSFDMTAAPVAGGFFVGDYEGLATVGRTFMPFFVQSTCTVPSPGSCSTANRTDVYATTITP